MKIQLLRDISKLLALTVGFYLLHFAILQLGNFEETNLQGVYLFMFGLTALAYIIIRVVHENDREKTAFMFLGFSMVKMMAAIMYLFPVYQSMGEAGKIFVLQFFMVYFLYLFVETLFVLKLFNSK